MAPRPFKSVMRTPALIGCRLRRKNRGRCLARRSPWTKQHAEGPAPLGGELQTADFARLRLPRPRQGHVTGARAEHLLESPQRTRATHHCHPIEHDALGHECRRKGHQGWGDPHAPACRRGTRQGGERRQQQVQLTAAETGDEDLDQTGARPAITRQVRIQSRKSAGEPALVRSAAAAPDGRMLEQTSELRFAIHDGS